MGLRALGVDAVPIDASPDPYCARVARLGGIPVRQLRPGRQWGRAISDAMATTFASPVMTRLQTRAARRELGRVCALDAIIHTGPSYRIKTELPLIHFGDMSVVQQLTTPYPGWSRLSAGAARRRTQLQRELYAGVDACCLVTPWAARSVIDDYGIPPEKVHVVGIGSNHGPRGNPNRDWRVPRFLFVGLDWHRKNGEAVLSAFSRVRQEHRDALLHVVGGHPPIDAPGVVTHGVLQRHIAGDCERLDQLFSEATCLVMPSHAEAAGIAFVEAARAGIPAIGSTVGGSDFLIGAGGTVVDPRDHDGLTAAMRWLSDPEIARSIGSTARQRSELFSWKGVAGRLLRAIDGMEPVSWVHEFGWNPAGHRVLV